VVTLNSNVISRAANKQRPSCLQPIFAALDAALTHTSADKHRHA
jgi:hypothetical protein